MRHLILALLASTALASCGNGGTEACLVTSGKSQKQCGGELLPCLCGITFEQCNFEDGKVYELDCANDETGSMDCECVIDDEVDGTFTDVAACLPESPDDSIDQWIAIANDGCGWDLSFE